MSSKAASEQQRKRSLALYAVLLSVAGLFVSIHLSYVHLTNDKPAWCEMSEHVSCSAVLSSSWAIVLRVPVAFWGVVYFGISIALSIFLASPRVDDKDVAISFLLLSWVGVASSVFFVYAEYQIGAICPLCTIVHALTLLLLPLAWNIFRIRAVRWSLLDLPRLIWSMRIWALVILLVVGTPVLFINLMAIPDSIYTDEQLGDFARCLNSNRVTVYTRGGCTYCQKQKDLLGSGFDLLKQVNCDDARELCDKVGIGAFPTWIKKSNSAYMRDIVNRGFRSIKELEEMSGCKMSEATK